MPRNASKSIHGVHECLKVSSYSCFRHKTNFENHNAYGKNLQEFKVLNWFFKNTFVFTLQYFTRNWKYDFSSDGIRPYEQITNGV